MRARIYQPARSAMQSGAARSRHWILEYAPGAPRTIDPLMGWTSSSDPLAQVRMVFDSREAAERYARDNGIPFTVSAPKRRQPVKRPRGYGENFAFDRRETWTH